MDLKRTRYQHGSLTMEKRKAGISRPSPGDKRDAQDTVPATFSKPHLVTSAA